MTKHNVDKLGISSGLKPSFGGTRIIAIAFPWIGHNFLIVSRSSSSLVSISSAKLTHSGETIIH